MSKIIVENKNKDRINLTCKLNFNGKEENWTIEIDDNPSKYNELYLLENNSLYKMVQLEDYEINQEFNWMCFYNPIKTSDKIYTKEVFSSSGSYNKIVLFPSGNKFNYE